MAKAILERRAVRKFEDTPVNKADVDQLVAAFEAAPCALGQSDDMEGLVVEDPTMVAKVEDATDNACYGAPLLFVIANKSGSRFADRNGSVAAENVMVQAASLGLGSVYVMSGALKLNDHPDVLKDLGIDDGYEATVIVPVGKAAGNVAAPDRSSRYKVIRK